MTHQVLVSIVIPTFNGAPWIRECVESALAQTETDIEVLVCDDASTDGTLDELADLTDERLRVIANTDNVGIPGNWNRALALSAGRYIKPLMQDDTLDPACVARLASALVRDTTISFCRRRVLVEKPDRDLARWALVYADPPARIHNLGPSMSGGHLFRASRRLSFRHNLIGEPTVVMFSAPLASQLGGFDARLHQFVDFELWLRLAARGRIAFVDEELATFRAHRGSATWRRASVRSILMERYALLRGLWSDPFSRRLMRYPDWPLAMMWAVAAGGRALQRDVQRRVSRSDRDQ